jgi:hypothetical protein
MHPLEVEVSSGGRPVAALIVARKKEYMEARQGALGGVRDRLTEHLLQTAPDAFIEPFEALPKHGVERLGDPSIRIEACGGVQIRGGSECKEIPLRAPRPVFPKGYDPLPDRFAFLRTKHFMPVNHRVL